jgi:hypothetical protein
MGRVYQMRGAFLLLSVSMVGSSGDLAPRPARDAPRISTRTAHCRTHHHGERRRTLAVFTPFDDSDDSGVVLDSIAAPTSSQPAVVPRSAEVIELGAEPVAPRVKSISFAPKQGPPFSDARLV